MRALRNLGIFLVLLLIVGVVADFGARWVIENRIESTIESSDAVTVRNAEADVSSFPFLGRLLFRGEIDSFDLQLENLRFEGGKFDTLELNVRGVVFDRDRLLNAQAQVQSLESATITAEITEATASEAVGVPVTFTPDTVTVVAGGQSRTVTAEVSNGELNLVAEGLGVLVIPIAKSEYFPCEVDTAVEQGKVVLSCTATELPPALRQVVGGGIN